MLLLYKLFILWKNIIDESMLVFIIVLLFVLLFFYPLKIRVIRNKKYNDISLYLFRRGTLKLDIDEMFRIISADDYSTNTLINLLIIYKNKDMIKSFLKFSKIKKITIVINDKMKDDEMSMYFTVTGWIILNNIRSVICNNFKSIKNEYYAVTKNDDASSLINVDVIFEVRIIYFLFTLLLNYKHIPTLIKSLKKGSEKYE